MRKEITFDSPEQFKKIKNKLESLKKICPNKLCGGTGHIMVDTDNGRFFEDCPNCTGEINKIIDYVKANVSDNHLNGSIYDTKCLVTPEFYKKFVEMLGKIDVIRTKFSIAVYRFNDENSYGTGTIASSFIKALIDEENECYCLTFKTLLESIFDFDKEKVEINRDRSLIKKKAQEIDCLMIEDFQTDSPKFVAGSFGYNKVAEFLNERKTQGKFTVISTDLTKVDFKNVFYGSIATIIENNYLPLEVKCMSGKHKHSAVAKFSKSNPEMAWLFNTPESTPISVTKPVTKIDDNSGDSSLDNLPKDTATNVRSKR